MADLTVGSLTVSPVHDGTALVPVQDLYEGVPALAAARTESGEVDTAKLAAVLDSHPGLATPTGLVELAFGGFLVRGVGDRVILVDTGFGPAVYGVYRDLYCTEVGQLLTSLAALGVAPSDVTDVVLTHLHTDHVGWVSDGGNVTFPNATYRCDNHDWDYFYRRHERISPIIEPIVERLDTWSGDATIAPGLDALWAPGHTPGSALIVLSSAAERAVLLGDVVHCPIELIDTEWDGISDVSPRLAKITREAVSRELSESKDLAVGAHFPGLAFGRLLVDDAGGRWTSL